jgi:hypothetical protein
MTYEEASAGQTIDRLLSEHPGLDPPSDGALDNLDQFHIGGPGAKPGVVAEKSASTR